MSYTSLIEHWLHCHDLLMEDAATVQNLLVMRYEEFVANPDDPAKQLLGLCVRAEEVRLPDLAAAECSERYAVEEDGAVIVDRETGLEWQQGGIEESVEFTLPEGLSALTSSMTWRFSSYSNTGGIHMTHPWIPYLMGP